PTAIELFGSLQGNQVEHGALALTMPLVDIMPTLPDPYIARVSGNVGGAADAVATVRWATPATPLLLFTSLPLAARLAAVLLDVSTNADLLGVAIQENAALGFQGQSLVAQREQLQLVAVPQISWEPLLTPEANWGFLSQDDGRAMTLLVQSTQ